METVVTGFPGYPSFLWITGCKILFIVSDQKWKTPAPHLFPRNKIRKNTYKSLRCKNNPQRATLLCEAGKLTLIF